jgi:uncharacterized protein YecA (UPF0149 family)
MMASLGSKRRPICVRVATEQQLQLVADECARWSIQFIAELAPGSPPELEELQLAIAARQPVPAQVRVGRNERCPCGSGRKFKKCCIDAALPSST